MLAKRIIPCLDVKDGKVVKGINFKNLRDVGNPPDFAKEYENQGADEVTFLDITASIESRKTMLDIVSETAKKLFVPLCVGGGIRNVDDMRNALNAGADKVSVNSAAVLNPGMITECADSFGRQCVVIAIDAKKKGDSWEVYTHGGTKGTGIDAIEWAQKVEDLGAGEILLTSMDAVMSRNVTSSAPCSSYSFARSGGCPTSLRFLKLIPLTTFPSLTSRQGMILLASITSP